MKKCLLALTILVIASGIAPLERLTWLLEVLPILLVMPIVWHYGRHGRISNLLLLLIVIHAAILCLGGHYTYAKVPLGDWIRDLGIGERNNYDKLGHLAQGFIPAIALREIMIRQQYWVRSRQWLGNVLIVLACGGISAVYEIIEMIAALILGGGADAFLGTQGFVWDTQSDMLMAMIGSALALQWLSKAHDRGLPANT